VHEVKTNTGVTRKPGSYLGTRLWKIKVFVATIFAILLWFQGITINIARKWLMPSGGEWLNGADGCFGRYHAAFLSPFMLLLLCWCAAINYMLLKRLGVRPSCAKQKTVLFGIAFALAVIPSYVNYGGTPISGTASQYYAAGIGYEWKWLRVRWEQRDRDCN
jgi:hypothetical protein